MVVNLMLKLKSMNKVKGKFKNCIVCDKDYWEIPSKPRKFCSQDCYWQDMKGKSFRRKKPIKFNCKNCGKEREVYPSLGFMKFCTKECATEFNRGENHHCWEGGKSTLYQRFLRSREYKKWRKEIFERDNYICQDCGFKGGSGVHRDLHPHHIKSASKYPEFCLDLDNGKTVCYICHGKIHSINFKNKKYSYQEAINFGKQYLEVKIYE